METPTLINTERIDDVPLLMALLEKMGVQPIIDGIIEPHGNRQGLSIGWLIVIWLTHILTEQTHCMDVVREWVVQLQETWQRLTKQEVRALDFTDDRLADVLRDLSNDQDWQRIEAELGAHQVRVYELNNDVIRLDGTSAAVYHDEQSHVLFQRGRGKQGQWDVQFQAMVGSIDPLGLPLAVDVVAGDQAEDPLYVPCYQRVKQTLDRDGLLVVGDAKMSALETRGTIVAGKDYYLTPLAQVGEVPGLLQEQLQRVWDKEQSLTDIFLPDDFAEDGGAPDPERAIAQGFVIDRWQETVIAGQGVAWPERCLILRSKAHAEAMRGHFQQRVDKAEQALRDLTPPPGRGKKQISDEIVLQSKIQALVDKYKVAGLLAIDYERQVSRRQIRGYGGEPDRVEERVRYQIRVQRNQQALEQAERLLGWRVYATNAPAERLTLTDAVLAYRDQYVVERIFQRLKGRRLSITPLYVQRDDHALGLIRLLTLAVRLLALTEYTARQALAETQSELDGIYPGNPKRSTARPTTERLLRSFQHIDLTTVHLPDRVLRQVTPLTAVQTRILALLGLTPDLYTNLASA